MINFKKLTIFDASQLSTLAVEAYNGSYLHIWHDEGRWYKETTYGMEILSTELANINNEFYFAELEGKVVGYLKIQLQTNLNGHQGDGMLIERIYFLKEYTGKGLGAKLIQFAFDIAINLNKDYAWLNAMDTSASAIKFYQKIGFDIVGTYQLSYEKLIDGFQGMAVMKKELK